ncbi:MAG TPA: NAD-dependent epimerase/dehydratase family protein [Candidatus Limnocylindrales bacterium]|nr:NAD-dependent epimerase/dehydratase family protein [Candidatus Limnocylindrales bacterium]
MKILITGGAGFVGRAAVRAAVEAGHQVRIVSRDAWPSGSTFERLGVDVVTGDAQLPSVIDKALDGMDALVQGAATYRYDRKSAPAMANNAALARIILEAALRAKTPKVVDISSLVVFALGHSPITEATPLTAEGQPAWNDPYLRSKVESERVGVELEGRGLPRVTVHPGTVIGPEDTAMGTSSGFITNLLAGGITIDSRAPWVDVRDVAAAIVLALDKPSGSHYLLTSGVVTHREVATMLDELTGRQVGRRFMSKAAVRRFAIVNDLVGGRLNALPASTSLDWILDNAAAVDTSSTRAALGLELRPLRETLRDAIRWWAEHDMVNRELAGKLAPTPV